MTQIFRDSILELLVGFAMGDSSDSWTSIC